MLAGSGWGGGCCWLSVFGVVGVVGMVGVLILVCVGCGYVCSSPYYFGCCFY